MQSRNQRKNLVKQLRAICTKTVQEKLHPLLHAEILTVLGKEGWTLHTDETDPNTLLFSYPSALPQNIPSATYIRPVVKLEIGAGSDPYPVGTYPITPYAAETLPAAFIEPSCNVIVLEAERTFWEKATLLHAEHHRSMSSPTPPRISRHYYDLSRLANSPKGTDALRNLELLKRVATHKSVYFASSWAHYELACPGTLRLLPPKERLRDLARDYDSMKGMFFGEYPSFDEVLDHLSKLERSVNQA